MKGSRENIRGARLWDKVRDTLNECSDFLFRIDANKDRFYLQTQIDGSLDFRNTVDDDHMLALAIVAQTGFTVLGLQSKPGINYGFGLGVTALKGQSKDRQTGQIIETSATNLLLLETFSFNVPIPRHQQELAVLLTGFFYQPALLSALATYLPIDILVSPTQLVSPPYAAGSALNGPYLSVGLGASAGIGSAPILSGIHALISNKVDASSISTTIGGSLVLQGFSFGISLLNTGLTLKPSAGVQFITGLSIGWGLDTAVGSPSTDA